jgi:hypothetical protein
MRTEDEVRSKLADIQRTGAEARLRAGGPSSDHDLAAACDTINRCIVTATVLRWVLGYLDDKPSRGQPSSLA